MVDDGFLTTAQVLEYLHVNLRTVYRLIKAGKIPAVRVGRQWRFRKREIDAWLASEWPGQHRTVAGGAASADAPPPPRARVLVADEAGSVRELLAKALAIAECDVDEASDGGSAVDRLRLIKYDLLVTELNLQVLDGLAVIREARRFTPGIAVIIITGSSSEASAIQAANLGVSAYLTKPFRVPQLLAAAARALGE